MEAPHSPPSPDPGPGAVSRAAAEGLAVAPGPAQAHNQNTPATVGPGDEAVWPPAESQEHAGTEQAAAPLDDPPLTSSPGQGKQKASKAWDGPRARPVFGPVRQPRLPEPGQRGFLLARTVAQAPALQGTLLVADTAEALAVAVPGEGAGRAAGPWLQALGGLLGCADVQAHWAGQAGLWVLAGQPGSQASPVMNRPASALAGCRIFGDALLLAGSADGRLHDYGLQAHAARP